MIRKLITTETLVLKVFSYCTIMLIISCNKVETDQQENQPIGSTPKIETSAPENPGNKVLINHIDTVIILLYEIENTSLNMAMSRLISAGKNFHNPKQMGILPDYRLVFEGFKDDYVINYVAKGQTYGNILNGICKKYKLQWRVEGDNLIIYKPK